MKKVILLIVAIIAFVSSSNAQQNVAGTKSEPTKKTVIARLTVKNESADQFVKLSQVIVAETRKESGCISYHLYKNCIDQETEFIFYEEYKDQAALDFHNNSQHLASFFTNITSLLASTPIVETF